MCVMEQGNLRKSKGKKKKNKYFWAEKFQAWKILKSVLYVETSFLIFLEDEYTLSKKPTINLDTFV